MQGEWLWFRLIPQPVEVLDLGFAQNLTSAR
jgi:hypothetical protein